MNINEFDKIGLEVVKEHFSLTALQMEQFSQLGELYRDWNSKINVISRKDIDNLFPHHIIHSLAIAKVLHFEPGTTLLDVGTGGGFPGIPLAILFPDCQFTLIDSIGKKVRVASEVAQAIGLKNVRCIQERAEEEIRHERTPTREPSEYVAPSEPKAQNQSDTAQNGDTANNHHHLRFDANHIEVPSYDWTDSAIWLSWSFASSVFA